jgi:hypothetical protein
MPSEATTLESLQSHHGSWFRKDALVEISDRKDILSYWESRARFDIVKQSRVGAVARSENLHYLAAVSPALCRGNMLCVGLIGLRFQGLACHGWQRRNCDWS